MIIGDYNTSLNTDLDYVGYSKDPHTESSESSYMVYSDMKMESSLMCTDFCTPMISATPGKYTRLKND